MKKTLQRKKDVHISQDRQDSDEPLGGSADFAIIMFAVYYIAVTWIGSIVTDFTNETLFAEWICEPLRAVMENASVAPWLVGLVVDGIVGGVGSVIGLFRRCSCCSVAVYS